MSIHLERLRPADDYVTLRRQFLALKRLAMCMQARIAPNRGGPEEGWEEWRDDSYHHQQQG